MQPKKPKKTWYYYGNIKHIAKLFVLNYTYILVKRGDYFDCVTVGSVMVITAKYVHKKYID